MLYAGLAGWLTFSLCKWATGSGITEVSVLISPVNMTMKERGGKKWHLIFITHQVKAILNGYVIKSFASFRSLVVKFLGLVGNRSPCFLSSFLSFPLILW